MRTPTWPTRRYAGTHGTGGLALTGDHGSVVVARIREWTGVRPGNHSGLREPGTREPGHGRSHRSWTPTHPPRPPTRHRRCLRATTNMRSQINSSTAPATGNRRPTSPPGVSGDSRSVGHASVAVDLPCRGLRDLPWIQRDVFNRALRLDTARHPQQPGLNPGTVSTPFSATLPDNSSGDPSSTTNVTGGGELGRPTPTTGLPPPNLAASRHLRPLRVRWRRLRSRTPSSRRRSRRSNHVGR